MTGSTDADRSLLRQVTIARAGPGPFKETTVMADLALIVLTLAVFAMLGLVVKAVGRL